MGDVPETITTALDGVPVASSRCLEAGAGAGNATAALRERGAEHVWAVTNNNNHASSVRERFREDSANTSLVADLRELPLPDDSVHVITAHALFNVITTTEVQAVVAELSRVAEAGSWLVVDDYGPVSDERVRSLFGVENAVAELVDAQPMLTFYPRDHLRALVTGAGWNHKWTRGLLDPVPWTADLLDAHAQLAIERSQSLPEPLGDRLRERARAIRARAGDGIETGEMYSLVFRRSS